MPEGVNRAYELWREAAEKFDYFMAGLCAAVLGFLAPKFEAARFGCNAESLELVAMLFFVGSVFASFKRLESTVHLQRIAIGRLEQLDGQERAEAALRGDVQLREPGTAEAMSPAALQELLDKRKTLVEIARTMEKNVGKRAERWYSARYYLLLVGFVLLIAARVWMGYR